MTAGTLIQQPLDAVGEQHAGHDRPESNATISIEREPARRRIRAAARATTSRILARYSHITARTDPNWIITVNTPPGSSKPSGLADEQQVRGGRDRQELGESLHDPEQRGEQIRQADASDAFGSLRASLAPRLAPWPRRRTRPRPPRRALAAR